MNISKKILVFLLLCIIVCLPTVALGADLLSIVTKVSTNLKALSGGLATIAFVVSGLMFLSATGNPSRMAIAKGSLIAGVIGITIIALASGAEAFVKTFMGV